MPREVLSSKVRQLIDQEVGHSTERHQDNKKPISFRPPLGRVNKHPQLKRDPSKNHGKTLSHDEMTDHCGTPHEGVGIQSRSFCTEVLKLLEYPVEIAIEPDLRRRPSGDGSATQVGLCRRSPARTPSRSF